MEGDGPLAETAELEALERPGTTNYFSIPEGQARPIDGSSYSSQEISGWPQNPFGRTRAPLTSLVAISTAFALRWMSILLLRAPAFAVETRPRAFTRSTGRRSRRLLLRMGEADAARC